VLARGVLYAPEAIVAPPPAVLEAIGARDRPREGEVILEGQPVCTLASGGATRDETVADLARQAAAVRALLAASDADRARSYGQDAIVASRPGEP
jgi:predicted ATP-grasp superfamily ATP-dependent carboligase